MEQQSVTKDLGGEAVAAAIAALRSIDKNSIDDGVALEKLLADEKLSALKRTPEYVQWRSSR